MSFLSELSIDITRLDFLCLEDAVWVAAAPTGLSTYDWVLIECNDGQESGYAGISPLSLWQKIIEIERGHKYLENSTSQPEC